MGRRLVGTGLVVAGGLLLLQLAWMLTMPRATGIDEVDHIHRAASVAAGHWGYSHQEISRDEGRGGLIPVPDDIVAATHPACKILRYNGPANCNPYADAGDGEVLVTSAAARYNPSFYVLVGYPASIFEGATAVLVMRVVAALLCAGMLGLGAIAIRTWARSTWPMLGLLVAGTPTVMYSSSIAAPNGLHICAGLTLWAALLGLLYANDDAATRRLLLSISGLAAVTLVNTHTLGVVWLCLIAAAVLIQRGRLSRPSVPVELRRFTQVLLVLVLCGVASAIGWVLMARTNSPSSEGRVVFHGSWFSEALSTGLPLWPMQAIAAFPMRDEMAPLPVYAIGLWITCLLAALAIRSLLRGRRWSSLLSIGFVAAFSLIVPFALTAVSYGHLGLAWQGRYEMPFTGGLLLLYTVALDRAGTRLPAFAGAGLMGLMALMNLLGQIRITSNFTGSAVAAALDWSAAPTLVLALLALGYAAACTVVLHRAPAAEPAEVPAREEQYA